MYTEAFYTFELFQAAKSVAEAHLTVHDSHFERIGNAVIQWCIYGPYKEAMKFLAPTFPI